MLYKIFIKNLKSAKFANMTSHYDTMQVCAKGHVITDMHDTYPVHRQDFCLRCGSRTTTACPYCHEKIRGFYHVSGVIGGTHPNVPLNCHRCGEPYPWRTKAFIREKIVIFIKLIDYFADKVVGIFKR